MSQVSVSLPPELTFRDPQPGDIALVLDSWSKGYRNSKWAGTVPNNLWHETHVAAVTQLLARGARLLVLCSTQSHDQIVGYACWEPVSGGYCVHYLYIKDPFRRRGLGRALLERTEELHGEAQGHERGINPVRLYSHRTDASRWFRGWTHAPEVARRK